MEAFREFYGRHGIALTLIILAIIGFIWVWILVKIANLGSERYGLRMIASWSMGLIVVGFISFVLGAIFHPTECAQPCDLSLINKEHFEIFGSIVGATSLLALILNIRKSNLVFGFIFTLAQASIAFFAVLLLFIVMYFRGEAKDRRARGLS